jgi:hypothetical protein
VTATLTLAVNAYPGQGVLSGVVTRADGTPIAGATVLVRNNATGVVSGPVTTDAAGFYQILNLAPGTDYTVTVMASGFVGQSRDGVVIEANRMTQENFTLVAGDPANYRLFVTVTGPAANIVTVTLGGTELTHVGGIVWERQSMTPITGVVTASAPNFRTVSASVPAPVAGVSYLTLELTALTTGYGYGGIFGVVTGNSPIENATIVVTNAAGFVVETETTNAAGEYVVVDLVPGTYTVTATAPGHSTVSYTVVVSPNQMTERNFTLTQQDGNYILLATITGVVEADLGTVSVTVDGATFNRVGTNIWEARTDAPLPSANMVRASAPQHTSDSAPVGTYSPEGVAQVALELRHVGLGDDRGGIYGQVRQLITVPSPRFEPIVGATVLVHNAAGALVDSVVTNQYGAYEFVDLPEGSYRVTVLASGFQTYVREGVAVATGQMTRADITLAAGGLPGTYILLATVTGAPADQVTVVVEGATFHRVGTQDLWEARTMAELPSDRLVTATAPGHTVASEPVGDYTNNVASVALALTRVTPGLGEGGLYGVVTALGGGPIAGATVVITNAAGQQVYSTTTNAFGHFVTEESFAPGAYRVTVVAPGFVSQSREVTIAQDEMTRADFTLTPGGAPGAYTLLVTVTGAPADAVTVRLGTTTLSRIGTSDIWEHRTADPATGQTVTASAQNFRTETRTVPAPQNNVSSLTINLQSLTPYPGYGGIFGVVSGPDGPIENATVIVTDAAGNYVKSVTTDENGVYTVMDLAPGSYTVLVTAPGYSTVIHTVLVEANEMTERNFALTPQEGNFILLATVRGATNLDVVTVAAEGATFHRVGTSDVWEARTNTALPDDRLVTASAPAHIPGSAPVGTYENGVARVTLTLVPVGLTYGQGGIYGVVTRADGTPIAGATVIAVNNATGVVTPATTNAAGFYQIVNLVPGTYTVTVTAAGFVGQSRGDVAVEANQMTAANFQLAAGDEANYLLVVTVGGGAPADAVTVTLGGTELNRIGQSNVWERQSMTAITGVVTASAPNFHPASASVPAAVEGVSRLSLTLQAFELYEGYGGIYGVVSGLDGPIANATVIVTDAAGNYVRSAVTNASGVYTVMNLAPGTYTVTATAPGHSTVVHTVVVEEDEMTERNFTLTQQEGNYILLATVTGAPLDAVSVTVYGATFNRVGTSSVWEARTAAQLPDDRQVTASAAGHISASAPVGQYTNGVARVWLALAVEVIVTVELRHYETEDLLPAPEGFTYEISVPYGGSITVQAPHIADHVIYGADRHVLEAVTEDETVVFLFRPFEEGVGESVILTIIGRVGTTELYRHNVTRPVDSGAYTVHAFQPPGFRLVTGAAASHTFDVGTEPQQHIFEYENLATRVQIRAVVQGTTELVPGFTPFYVAATLGQPFTQDAPHIPGFNLVGSLRQTIEAVTEQNNVLTFQYVPTTGNVTILLREVDAENNLIGIIRVQSMNIARNTPTTIPVPDLGAYHFTALSQPATVIYTGTALTVEFNYRRDMANVTVRAMHGTTVLATWPETVRLGAVSSFAARPVEGYVLRDATPRLVMVTASGQYIDFQYEPVGEDQVLVEAVLREGEGANAVYTIIYNYVVTAQEGSTVTANAPTLLGFRLVSEAQQTVTVPGTIRFVFVRDEVTVTMALVNHNTNAPLTAPVGVPTVLRVPRGGDIDVFAPHIPGFAIHGAQIHSLTNVTEDQTVTFRYVPIPVGGEDPPVRPPMLTDEHHKYLIGFGDGTIRPNAHITRAETATIFFRLLEDEYRARYWRQWNNFHDVAVDAWYNNAISTLANLGIVQGFPDGSFHPNASVTRGEFVAMASRFVPEGVELLNEDRLSLFNDLPGHWAQEYIQTLLVLGWMGGDGTATFRPDERITRAEVASAMNRMLDRQLQNVAGKSDATGTLRTWADNANQNSWYFLDIKSASHSVVYERSDCGYYVVWQQILPMTTLRWYLLERPDATPTAHRP